MTEQFAFKESLIYVQDGKSFELKYTDFQQILENRKYPEFPIVLIALKYQIQLKAFIFNSNNIKLVKYFEEITSLFNDDMRGGGTPFEINDKLAIMAYAEEYMAIIRKGKMDSHSFDYTYKGKTKTITGQDLFNYYNHSDTHNPTVKDFIIKLGIFSDKMNNKEVTITSKKDAYNKYRYLEGILTKNDKEKIESWKEKRQDLTKTDYDHDKKSQKSDAIDNIFTKATRRFQKNIDRENLAKKDFGKKFFKTVKEYVNINGLDDLKKEIYQNDTCFKKIHLKK